MKPWKYIKTYYSHCEKFLGKYSKTIAILLAIFYSVLVLLVTLNRFWQFEAFYYDHGYYESTIWNISRFKSPTVQHPALGRTHIFADHVVPSMFLITPVYWLTDRYETTIIVLALGAGFSVYFAYLIASKLIKNQFMIFALLFAYMFYVGMQNALTFLLHPTTLMIFPLMLLFWAIVNKKITLYYILLIINLGFKETVVTLTFALSIFLYFYSKKWRRHALVTALITITHVFLVTKVIVPPLSPTGAFNYNPQWAEIATRLVTGWILPIKIQTMLATFTTFGFLPIFNPIFLPTIMQDFLLRYIIGPQAGFRWDLGQYYNSNLVVLMFFGSVIAVSRIQRMESLSKIITPWAILIFILVSILHRFVYHGPFGLAYNLEFYKHTFRQDFMWDFINKIPRNGKVMLQNNIAVFFTHNDVYILKDCQWINTVKPDVIAFDFRPGQNVNNWWPTTDHEMRMDVALLKESPAYSVKYNDDYRYIFIKSDNNQVDLPCSKANDK